MTLTIPKSRIKRVFFDSVSGRVYHSIADVLRRLEINPETVDMFIRLGYVSGDETLFKGIQCLPGGATIKINDGKWKVIEQFRYGDLINKDIYRHMPEEELIKCGKQIWLGVIGSLYDSRAEIVVPISGGLDSRAILAGLLECANAASIQTYTFGLPGTYDYEIGNRVAAQAGTRHTRFDLSRFTFGDEILAETCRQTDGNVNIFLPAFSLPIIESYAEGAEFWSGFMGDPLAGSHIPKEISHDADKATRAYYFREARNMSSHSIPSKQLNNWIDFIDIDSRCSKQITLDEQLDFYLRQERCIANQLFLHKGSYVAPFIENEWAEFMLSVPFALRIKERIYISLLQQSFPSLFNLPAKGTCGLSLDAGKLVVTLKKIEIRLRELLDPRYLNPGINYIDFNRELRLDSQLKRQLEASVAALKKRHLLDNQFIDSLWKEHQARKQNNSLLLMNIASLENIIRTFDVRC